MQRRLRAVVALVAVCATASVAAVSAVAAAPAARPAASGTLPTVNATLTGKSVSMPATVESGAVNLSVTTSAKASSLAIVKLDPGVTVPDVFKLLAAHHQDPNALLGSASIIADVVTPKGTSTVQTTLTPGDYAAVDIDAKGVPPFTTFTVTQATAPATLAAPAATVATQDFRFVAPATLHDGETVRFENQGYVTHMVVAASFPSKSVARKAIALLRAGHDGPAQKLATGFAEFMDVASPGAMQQQTVNAKPGVYVLACFMATQDGREHTTLGMLKLVRITK